MKTFKDLEFKPHPSWRDLPSDWWDRAGYDKEWKPVQATMTFENGFGVSVIQGPMLYTSNKNEWELAVFHGTDVCYESGLLDDVAGHLSADEVTDYMLKIQQLEPAEHEHKRFWEKRNDR